MSLIIAPSSKWLKTAIASLMLTSASLAFSDSYSVLQGMEDEPPQKGSKIIPFPFYNDNVEAALSIAYVGQGYIQPQVNIVANAFYSSNESGNVFLLVKDIQAPIFDRLFLDAWGFAGEWGNIDSYRNGNPSFASERAGSHDSDEDNFIESEGDDRLVKLDFRYVLPMGHGRGNPIHKYVLDGNGELIKGSESGGDSWNPFASGRTFIEFSMFDREQNVEDSFGNGVTLKTTAASLGLSYDNTDYWNNPTYGSRQRVAVTRDWGSNDEDGASWTTIEAEYSKFFNLGESETAFQRVLAFNAWAIDTPTWDDSSLQNGKQQFHRPPVYQGATLGGIDRQRAYATGRFNDRSAINYALEYRQKNKWNPFPNIPLINKLNIPWWQWVGFVELGRVNDEWNLSDLHEDMKWTVGGGVRVMIEGVAVRLDIATSEEQASVQMFIGQTF